MTTRARIASCLLVLLALTASGCELVADFDRSRIPDATDGGGGPSIPDGSLVPPATDAGNTISDAAPAPETDAAMPEPTLDAGASDSGAPVDGAVPSDAG